MPLETQDLEKSNNRIALVGRWTADSGKVYRFSKSADKTADGTVRVLDLFASLKPHLQKKDHPVQLANGTKNGFTLGPPEGNGDRLELLADSDLLTGAAGDVIRAQVAGGELVDRMVDALDRLIPFNGSKFSTKLLEVAAGYLHEAAQNMPGHHWPDPGRLATLVRSDHALGEVLVRFLTCYDADEPEILSGIRVRLKELSADEIGRDVFTTEFLTEQIDALLEAMRRCKTTLLDGPETDPLWHAQFSAADNRLELGLDTDDLFDLYRRFRVAADAVHRLVRTEPMHASITLWLFSKYHVGGAFQGSAGVSKAAAGAFDLGVERWGDERVRALTDEQKRDFAARVEAAQADRTGIPDDDAFFDDYLKEIGLYAFRILHPKSTYTKKELEARAGKLFIKLAERAGEVGVIVSGVEDRLDALQPVWVALLNLDDDDTADAMTAKLTEKLAQVGGGAPKSFEAGRVTGDTKQAFLGSFVDELARSGKQDLAQGYRDQLGKIRDMRKHLGVLYRALRGGAAAESTQTTAGTAGIGLADVTLRAEDAANARLAKQEAAMREEAAGAGTGQHSSTPTASAPAAAQTTPAPSSDAEAAPAASTDDASTESPPAAPTPEGDEAADSVDSGSDDDGRPMADVTLGRDPLDSDSAPIRQRLPDFAEIQDKIVSYVSCEDGEAYRGHLQALILSEFILASPGGKTSLGDKDLSNLLGLLIDIVEHTGAARRESGAAFYRPGRDAADATLSSCLQGINLSRYFPANTSADLGSVISWLRKLNDSVADAKVSEYLDALRQLRDTFALLEAHGDPDLEVVVIDDTLQGLASYGRPKDSPLIQEKPGILYLTPRAGNGLGPLAKQLRGFVDSKTVTHVPLIVSGDGASNRLPHLTHAHLTPIVDAKKGEFSLAIEGLDVDLPPVLLLALAPRLADGSLGHVEVDISVGWGAFPKADPDETLCSYLRRLWLTPTVLRPYLSSRWATVVSSLVNDAKSWDQLLTSFGQHVDGSLADPENRQAAYRYLPLPAAVLGQVEILGETLQEGSLGQGSAEQDLGAKIQTRISLGTIDWLSHF
ncbi:MAG: hypothetical protein AAGM22_26785 [Acidobacteriota bacterium]